MTEPGEGDGAKEDEIKSPEYNMADFEWLRQKGFTERDSTSLAAEGVGPGVTTSIIEVCLNNKELKVTRAGKRLLKSLNSEVSSDDPGSPGGNQSTDAPAQLIVQGSPGGPAELSLDGPHLASTGSVPSPQPHSPEQTADDSPNSISSWLKLKGLCQADIKALTDEGFGTAQGFETLLPEDLNNLPGLTRGGKRVLQRLMTEFKELRNNFTRFNPASSVIAESLPWANIVRFVVDIPLGTSGQGSQVTEYSCELTHSPTPSSNVRNVTFRYSAKLDYSNNMSEDHKLSDD